MLLSKRAVVLLSGGMDSVTVLALAKAKKYQVYALSFDYGQLHSSELNAAKKNAKYFSVIEQRVIKLDMGQFGGSALTDHSLSVPTNTSDSLTESDIPITYVPARNTVFLSYAMAWAEVLGANDIFIGVNAVDYSGYPDCRPEYIAAFEKMANLATKAGVEGNKLTIHTPLIAMTKAEIINAGIENGVHFAETVSCYQATRDGLACGECDACRLRKQGFEDAGVKDKTRYV